MEATLVLNSEGFLILGVFLCFSLSVFHSARLMSSGFLGFPLIIFQAKSPLLRFNGSAFFRTPGPPARLTPAPKFSALIGYSWEPGVRQTCSHLAPPLALGSYVSLLIF